MNFRYNYIFFLVLVLIGCTAAYSQADSLIAQLTNSDSESFAGGISGNGRFIVFESQGDVATENPRNADRNTEIFLFDYAQRRIFQITDTKSVLFDPNGSSIDFSNVRINIINTRPVISNDGKWIAFSSNATTSRPTAPDSTNPGSFNGNAFSSPTPTPSPSPTPTGSPTPTPSPTGSPTPTPVPAANPLTNDANTEIWLYRIPDYATVANLSLGDEIPFTELAGGTFTRVTNTDPSQLPRAATSTTGAFVADDNHDASISDDGNVIAFGSTRDLVPSVGNAFPTDDNEEIFTYVRSAGTLSQVTKTPRGLISNPIYNKYPTISGNGLRVAFASTGDNPVVGMTGGTNPENSRNEEIFYTDLNASGAPTGTRKQVTTTTPTTAGDPLNLLDFGRRMSRDGRYIAFDSYADLANENGGTNYTTFALYLYDTTTSTFRRIGPRSDADSAATGGDVAHYPGFTDYDAAGTPSTLVLETRMNIKADGTVPTNASDGLNSNQFRPSQLYSYPLNVAASAATFTKLVNFPEPSSILASTQPIPSNSLQRMTFNMALSQLGTPNQDALSEVHYFLKPAITGQATPTIALFTGATLRPVPNAPTPSPTPSVSPTPSASPTPTPSPSPSPSPTPTASPTGSPTPTPTPVTPPTAPGISQAMDVVYTYTGGAVPSITARTAVGSIKRNFMLPLELSGVSLSVNGYAAGIKSVENGRIEFVAPRLLFANNDGSTIFQIVVNDNGTQIKSFVTVMPTQPDIFRKDDVKGPGGRTKAFNVTNTIQTGEPFVIRTVLRKGGRLVPSTLRIYATGVEGLPASVISVRLGGVTVAGIKKDPVLLEPGVYALDFDLPASAQGIGDVPVVVTVSFSNFSFTSRVDDTTSRLFVL